MHLSSPHVNCFRVPPCHGPWAGSKWQSRNQEWPLLETEIGGQTSAELITCPGCQEEASLTPDKVLPAPWEHPGGHSRAGKGM